MIRTLTIGLVCVTLAGCYHATVETGLPPSQTTVEDEWADAWLEGLVPPDDVDVAEDCPNGVARVETRRSFVNMVAYVVTLGIYSPMHITVTCAAAEGRSAAAMESDVAASPEEATRQLKSEGVVLVDLDG